MKPCWITFCRSVGKVDLAPKMRASSLQLDESHHSESPFFVKIFPIVKLIAKNLPLVRQIVWSSASAFFVPCG